MGLEDVLREVENLRRDLSAEIVIYEGSPPGERWSTGSGDRYSEPMPVRYWDKGDPRITKPDTSKREAARTELQQIYGSSEWYSAKYAAAKALGSNPQNEDLSYWLRQIAEALLSLTFEKEYLLNGALWMPDRQRRTQAIHDCAKLYELSGSQDALHLLRLAYNSNDLKEVRTEAGRALGYSGFRIFLHELNTVR